MREASIQQQFLSALQSGNGARIRDLISAGAEVNLPTNDPDGETPLIRAIAAGNLVAVQILIAAGADVNLPQKGGRSWTPLMFAHDKPAIARELILAGVNVNARTPRQAGALAMNRKTRSCGGATSLHLAAAANNSEVVKLLIE